MRLLLALAIVMGGVFFPAPAQADDVWSQLRDERGLVILMRHAIAPGGGDPPGFRLWVCSTQRQLSAEGRVQARAIGREFASRRVPIAQVRSSRWCRANETARRLNLGPVRATPALDSVFTASQAIADRKKRQTERMIRDHRGKRGVLILVGHQANIMDLTGIAPDSGAAVVVRADENGRVQVLGEVAPPGG
jgi:phosphohistidine phosphatase SixA